MSDSRNPMHGEGMFSGVQDYYAAFRPPVVSAVVNRILECCEPHVTAGAMVDLGTGTGQVVQAFAGHFQRIYAVEIDAGMIDRARSDWAARRGAAARCAVEWVHSDVAEWVVPGEADVSLVTICRSFHWMDQKAVLDSYAAMTRPRASVAVFGDSSFWETPTDWAVATREAVQSILGEQRKARDKAFQHHTRPYSAIVAESPFSKVETSVVPVDRSWRPNQVLGYLYSTSFAARDMFGDRRSEFEAALMDRLAKYVDGDGLLHETAEFKVVVGSKPQ